ncbi:MAG: signal recognition particle protein, partial [Actinomycetes bacterium]
DRFVVAQKMMKQMANGGSVPGMPPMPGMPGMRSVQQKKQPQKGKGAKKSGNPAKRAAQEAGIDIELPSATLTELPSAFKDMLK